jgi:hypothetical protein
MPKPSTFEIPLRCAVADRDFVVSFRTNRFLPGKYFFDGITKVSGGSAATTKDAITLAASALPWHKAKCAYCSAMLFVHCSKCSAFVCQGRVTGGFFFCTDSCGQSGRLTLADITVIGHQSHGEAGGVRCQPEASVGTLTNRANVPRLAGPQRFLPARKT